MPRHKMLAGRKKRFEVSNKDGLRIRSWAKFLPPEVTTAMDKRVYAILLKQNAKAVYLTAPQAERARGWFDFVPGIVNDEADEALAKKLDDFVTKGLWGAA